MAVTMKKLLSRPIRGRFFAPILGAIVLILVPACLAQAEPLTLPAELRSEWLRREGIVMAGSWEPLLFRVRRDGSDGYTPTAEQLAAYAREHSPEMIAQLKALGVNFIMMHCYKGGGLEAERRSMDDAVRFAQLCHNAGLRVGVYNYSGAFLWEPFFKEMPQAKDWVLLNANGQPLTYGSTSYRYYWNRNHAGAQAFYRQLVRFAVDDIRADLLHFDNYSYGPGRDANSVRRFREYLGKTFTADKLRQVGASDLNDIQPPMTSPPETMLHRAWLDFSCSSLADSYHEMSRYARTLRGDILIECNPGGPGNRIRPPVDHGRLLQSGEAFWDEGRSPGYIGGQLHTRIPTYKVAQRMKNIAFAYTATPLEMAESMAFNRDCLGCICWFEYGKIVARPGSSEPVSNSLAPYIRFFRTHRDLLRDARVVADAAVLRSFPSQVFAEPKYAGLTSRLEQALIENRVCFQIIYDDQLAELSRYRVLVLAGCVALSDRQVEQIKRYVNSGGRVCIVGQAGTYDEWLIPREGPALDELPAARVERTGENDNVVDAIRRACDNRLSVSIQAGAGLCSELTEQPGRRCVHLVNYRADDPVRDVSARLLLPPGRRVKSITLVSPERRSDLEVSFQERDGLATFSVPQVDVYEIAVVTMQQVAADTNPPGR
jgi:hypothetical protein